MLQPPRNPKVIALLILGGLLLAGAVMGIGAAGSWSPGVADIEEDGDQVTVTFSTGDRYFWLTRNPAEPVTVGEFAATLPGDQTVVRRASYQDADGLAYDERRNGPDDFLILAGFLYDITGIHEQATWTVTVAGPKEAGFLNDVQADSTSLLKKFGAILWSLPGIFWDDIKTVWHDLTELFAPATEDQSEGAAISLWNWLQANWHLILTITVLIVAAPLLGIDTFLTSLAAGTIFAISGNWFLAVGAVVIGFMLDDNPRFGRDTMWRAAATHVGDQAINWTYRAPRLMGAIVVYVGAIAFAWWSMYKGRPNGAGMSLLIGGSIAVFLALESARAGTKHRISFQKAGYWTAGAVFLMAVTTGGWLAYLGFQGVAWAFFLLAAFTASATTATMLRRHRVEASGKKYNELRERDRARRRIAGLPEATWEGFWSAPMRAKVMWILVYVFFAGTVAGFSRGAYFAGIANYILGATALLFALLWTLAPTTFGWGAEEPSPDGGDGIGVPE